MTNDHKLGSLKQNFFSFGGKKSEVQVSAGMVPFEVPEGESAPCLSPSCCWLRAVLGVPCLSAASLPVFFARISSLCTCDCFSSREDTVNGFRAHGNPAWLHLNLIHLQRPKFQRRSGSQEPGVRTSTYLFRGYNSLLHPLVELSWSCSYCGTGSLWSLPVSFRYGSSLFLASILFIYLENRSMSPDW